MEGFELIATGLWSIVPPILALVLALITKEVYSSLTIGVFTGMIIYQFTLNGVGGEQLVASFTMVPQMMAEQIAGNGALLLFLALLGALTVVIATAGGSRAYAEWVTTHVYFVWNIGGTWYGAIGMLGAAICMVVVSLFTKQDSKDSEAFFAALKNGMNRSYKIEDKAVAAQAGMSTED